MQNVAIWCLKAGAFGRLAQADLLHFGGRLMSSLDIHGQRPRARAICPFTSNPSSCLDSRSPNSDMARHSAPQASQSADLLLLVTIYVAEIAVALVTFSLYKKGGRTLSMWLVSAPGIAFVIGAILLIAALAWIILQWANHRASASRSFGLMMMMNIITIALIAIPFEIGIRLLARDTSDGTAVFQTVLLPRSWEKATTHYRQVLHKASGDLSYLVYNDTLGWTVGPNRRSANGLYFSSAEGLRAQHQGEILKLPTNKLRVALVGDSYAFGEGVRFEDSWGHLLERNVGETQVLNFGVPGYGVDQAYLRFREDALPWKPNVAILAFPRSDLYRTIAVYPFVNWPEWDMPFSKPRFVRSNGALSILNVPTLPPERMFGSSRCRPCRYLNTIWVTGKATGTVPSRTSPMPTVG